MTHTKFVSKVGNENVGRKAKGGQTENHDAERDEETGCCLKWQWFVVC